MVVSDLTKLGEESQYSSLPTLLSAAQHINFAGYMAEADSNLYFSLLFFYFYF